MVSDNRYIRHEYNVLRLKVAKILKDIYRYRDDYRRAQRKTHNTVNSNLAAE